MRTWARCVVGVAAGVWLTCGGAARAQDAGGADPDSAGAVGTVVVARAQPPTRLEQLLVRQQAVVLKAYSEVGVVQGEGGSTVRVLAVAATDAGKGEKQYGLAIQVVQATGVQRTTVSYIDDDELDSVAAALEAIGRVERPAGNDAITDIEGNYRTRGNIEVSNYEDNGARMVSVRSVQVLPITGQVVWATTRFRVPAFAQLHEQLVRSKDVVKRLKDAAK